MADWGLERCRFGGNKWLPSPTTYTIQSPRQLLRIDATVSDRIDSDTKWWNGSLIHSIFSKEEADSITAIPLSKYGQPDLRIWRGTSTGEFMVQSAYHLEKERKEVQRGESAHHSVFQNLWKTI